MKSMSEQELINKIKQAVAKLTQSYVSDEDRLAIYAGDTRNGESRYMSNLEEWVKANATTDELNKIKSLGYTVESFVSDAMSGIVPEYYLNISAHTDEINEKIINEEELTTGNSLAEVEEDYDGDVDAFVREYYGETEFIAVFGDLLDNKTIKSEARPEFSVQEYINALEA